MIVLVTKFTHGAWIVVIAMPLLFLMMTRIRRHYDRVAAELAPDREGCCCPAAVHAVVLVSKLHTPDPAGAGVRPRHPTRQQLTAVTVQTSARRPTG